jgi:tetratricopeptide (TPR) repeat protein
LTTYLPFYEESNGDIVKDWIKEGERPHRPENLPDNIWELLERSWNHDPEKRPTFQEISVSLSIIVKFLVDPKKNLPPVDNDLGAAFKYREFSSSPVDMFSHLDIINDFANETIPEIAKIKVPERTSSNLNPDFYRHITKFSTLNLFSKKEPRYTESFTYPSPPVLVVPNRPNATTRQVPSKLGSYSLEEAELIYNQGCNLFNHGYYTESIKYFSLIHERYPLASHKLAEIYFYSLGVDKDIKLAKQYATISARRELPESLNFLGLIWLGGKDYEKAMVWFIKAGELGFAGALNNLGLMFKDGLGCDRDVLEALRLFKKSMLAVAQFNMGVVYYKGTLAKCNYQLALECFQDASRRGFGEAELLISEMYRKGRGVPRDLRQAEYHYEQAKRIGNCES